MGCGQGRPEGHRDRPEHTEKRPVGAQQRGEGHLDFVALLLFFSGNETPCTLPKIIILIATIYILIPYNIYNLFLK